MKHGSRPSFGPLGLLHAQNQVIAQCPKEGEQITFTPEVSKQIVRAFEEIRKGYPLDRVLADPPHAEKLFKRCRQLDVKGSDYAIAMRLLRLRKSPTKSLRLAKLPVPKEKRNFAPYSFAAEMAASQIKYRYGASIDDMLAYPEIGREFDELCEKLHPGMTSLDYRLAALHIRKSHYCKKDERSLFDSLDDVAAESTLRKHATLDRINLNAFQKVHAVVGLVEEARVKRFLYITQTDDVSETTRPFTNKSVFDVLANSFWTPSLSLIRLYVYAIPDKFHNALRALWAKRLIHDKSPIFNTPIQIAGIAA